MSSSSLPPVHDPPLVYSPLPVSGKSVKEGWEEYNKRYKESIEKPDEYWSKEANKYITWLTPFKRVYNGTFLEGDVNWFSEGKLNACYNCVDRHLDKKADQTAIIWEADEPGQESKHITYAELAKEVSRIANVMKMMGVTNAGNQVAGWDKGLSVRMATEGEIWVQDPSRVWLL
jgi:hypothetical protein